MHAQTQVALIITDIHSIHASFHCRGLPAFTVSLLAQPLGSMLSQVSILQHCPTQVCQSLGNKRTGHNILRGIVDSGAKEDGESKGR